MTSRRIFVLLALVIVLGLGVAVGLTVAGGDGPTNDATDFDDPPYADGVEVGRTYNYSLSTHCGIHGTRIDGTRWRAEPPLDTGSGSPPRGWAADGPIGKLEIVSEDRAVFTSSGGRQATFVRDDLPGEVCA